MDATERSNGAAFWGLVSWIAWAVVDIIPFLTAKTESRFGGMQFDPNNTGAAYAFAAAIAGAAGILLTWQNGQISPGTAGITAVIDILVIAIVGGLGHPIGPFIGALIYVLLRTFALDALVAVGLDPQRFQLLIGCGFLIIVVFSPDGVVGLWANLRRRLGIKATPT